MPETRTSALAIRTEPARLWTVGVLQGTTNLLAQTGAWFADVAQRFASILAAAMGPAVFVAYTFAAWSLSANLAWTTSFPYNAGPLSNWLVWAGIAAGVHVASYVLRRHTRTDKFTRNLG